MESEKKVGIFVTAELQRLLNEPVRSRLCSSELFKPVPLCVKLYEVVSPTVLLAPPGKRACEKKVSFCLEPYHIFNLQSTDNAHLYMRIGLLNTEGTQNDVAPPKACIKVNDTNIPLPPPLTLRARSARINLKHPLDIAFAIKTDSKQNSIYISWISNLPYVFAVEIVRRYTISQFTEFLMSCKIKNSTFTKKMIKEEFQKGHDSGISLMNLKGSLICPIGKVKMEHPCRAYACNHPQCFDVKFYVEMNDINPKWICPLCHESATFDELIIDGLFLDIICKAPDDCIEVEFQEDGSWTPLKPAVDTSHDCTIVLD